MNKPREKWYRQNGAEGDVVISTRVRLSRNLSLIHICAIPGTGSEILGRGPLRQLPAENLPREEFL